MWGKVTRAVSPPPRARRGCTNRTVLFLSVQGYPNFVATYGRGYPGFAPSYGYQFPGECLRLRGDALEAWDVGHIWGGRAPLKRTQLIHTSIQEMTCRC